MQAKQADHNYHSGGSGGEQPSGIYILPSFRLRSQLAPIQHIIPSFQSPADSMRSIEKGNNKIDEIQTTRNITSPEFTCALRNTCSMVIQACQVMLCQCSPCLYIIQTKILTGAGTCIFVADEYLTTELELFFHIASVIMNINQLHRTEQLQQESLRVTCCKIRNNPESSPLYSVICIFRHYMKILHKQLLYTY